MHDFTRRDVLGSAALLGGWLMVSPTGGLAQTAASQPATATPVGGDGPWKLSDLPYGLADLEPHIDAQTVKLHHDVHHAGYVRAANQTLMALDAVRRTGGDEIRHVRALTDALTFNLAGHALHEVYWSNMKKDGGGDPPADSEIAKLLKRDFGTLEGFYGQFQAAAAQVQGSGWGLLVYDPLARRLLVMQAEKHQNSGGWGVVPLLTLDVWEHAYYLKYQNLRTSYIRAFMNVINWASVDERLKKCLVPSV
ncbi:MAG: superoxide dismutase [Phycisphaerae bacterium]